MLHLVHLSWVGFELTTSVVIGTDCIGRCKSNYYTITTITAPIYVPKSDLHEMLIDDHTIVNFICTSLNLLFQRIIPAQFSSLWLRSFAED
jgi:hypothetical protein